MKKNVKARVKAKVKDTKKKVKGKLKGAAVVALFASLFAAGCLDTAPASRATTATYRIDARVCLDEGVKSVTVNMPFTFGDGALASADSAGSTETQTATPTVDVRTQIDARYNDALSAANSTSKSVLSAIKDGKTAVLELMRKKDTGTVEVTKTDGTTASVQCTDGQCSWVEEEVVE